MKAFAAAILGSLFALFFVVTINGEEENKSDKEKKEEEKEIIVNYEVIQQGTYSGKKDAIAQVITNQNDWEKLWKEHVSVLVPQPPVPVIDFETSVVAVIFMGEKKTGGYTAVIKDVSVEMDNVVIEYRLTEPQPNSLTLQVITQPYVMIKMDKPKGTVKLVKV